MVKSCYVPREEYAHITHDITATQKNWYEQFTSLAGVAQCTYIVHILGAHLHQQVRALGPISETSTYPFEFSYSKMRRMFKGSQNTLKQVLTNHLLDVSTSGPHHRCEPSARYGPWSSQRSHDNLVYTFQGGYQFYKIVSVLREQPTVFEAKAFIMTPIRLECTSLPFQQVGVFARTFPTRTSVELPKASIKGKVIIVEDAMISVPLNILQET